MREMLEKVPEGDWLCEECKDAEENEKKRLGKSEVVYHITKKGIMGSDILHSLCFCELNLHALMLSKHPSTHFYIYGCMLTFMELNSVVQMLMTKKWLKLVQPHKFLAKDSLITLK